MIEKVNHRVISDEVLEELVKKHSRHYGGLSKEEWANDSTVLKICEHLKLSPVDVRRLIVGSEELECEFDDWRSPVGGFYEGKENE